jgi:hypothetical protein
MKKIIFFTLLGGFTLTLNSCSAGYVAEPLTYVEVSIPPRPYPNYIWIQGGWVWSYSRNTYIQKPGYWVRPNSARSHRKGSWKKYDRGYRWEKSRR